ncbi:MAG TPA: hypothetical protein VFY99_05180 [Solirubrobacterales bacterium]
MAARTRLVAGIAASLALAAGVAACGSDDEDSTSASDETTETASAEEVTVTTGDTEGGYTWEVEPTPTTETKEVTFVNDSDAEHGLIFAKLNEGYTLEEAYELEGRKGSTVPYVEGGAKPGTTETFEVENPVEPGKYVLLCPIPGHYQQGQLEEGEIS